MPVHRMEKLAVRRGYPGITLALALTGVALLLLWKGLGTVRAAPFYQSPSNDDFANALVVSTLPYSNTQSTTSATTQAGDPAFPCIANSGTTNNGRGWHSVWYAYTATVTGTLHADTTGSDYDTVLGVWTGAWGSLSNVGCDDDSGPGTQSLLDVAIVSGTVYYIEVAGYYSSSSGNLTLSVEGAPLNDDFDTAFAVSSTPYTYTQNTTLATTAADDPAISCGGNRVHSHSVWYRFTAPSDGAFHVDTSGSGYDTVLAVWTGTRGSLTEEACDDDSGPGTQSSLDLAVSGGATYYIEVVSFGDTDGGLLEFYAFFSVGKPLYLHHLASPVTAVDGTSTTQIMDRHTASGVTATVTFDTQATYFYLYPGLAGGLGLRGTIYIPLYLDGDTQQSSNVTASLVDLAPGGSTTSIGSATQSVPRNSHAWRTFTIADVNYTVPQGHALRLSLVTANANQDVTLEYDSATYNSRVELLATSFVAVEQASTSSACRPAGGFFSQGQALTVTARVSDPFGSYDIAGADVRITAPGGSAVVPGAAMAPVLTATGAITYEYGYAIPTTATLGSYTVVVTGTESNGVRDTGNTAFVVQSPAALTVSLSATPATINTGQAITVTTIVTNTGQAAANGVTPTLSIGGTGSAALASGPIPVSATVSAGGTATFAWVYTATGAGTVNWTGNAVGTDANSCVSISSPLAVSNDVLIWALALLSISKSDSPDPVGAGTTLTYTLVYTNAGPSLARNVAITDTLAAEVVFGGVVSATPPITLTSTSPPVWYTPTLAAGVAGTIVFTVTVGTGVGDTITNSVTITGTTTDPDPADNRADETTAVVRERLVLTKSAGYVPGDWWNSNWTDRVKLTFDNAAQSENLANFPVLVVLNSSRIDYAKTQDAGQDIRFVDADGATVLAHEIERWDEAGDSYVWVRVPQIDGSSDADYIWLYYGNPSAPDGQGAENVWDSNYRAVWHLNESVTAGQTTPNVHVDSTSNHNHGTQHENGVTAGKIAGGQSFDGNNDYVDRVNPSNMPATNAPMTLETWAYYASDPGNHRNLVLIFQDPGAAVQLGFRNGNSVMAWMWGGNSLVVSPTLPTANSWHHHAYTYDGTTNRLYVDGLLRDTSATALQSGSTTNVSINIDRWGECFNGDIDEVRVSAGARSNDWVAAQYKSMTDAFITFSSESATGAVIAGDTLTYTINVVNNGMAPAAGVLITDVVPANTSFVTATLPHTGPASGVITWSLGTLNVGVSRTVTMVVRVDSAVAGGTSITNTAWVVSSAGFTSTDTITTSVVVAANLAADKSDTPDPVAAGATLTYTLVYTNVGPSLARNVTITDLLPAGVTFGGVVDRSPPIPLISTSPPAWYTPTLAAGVAGTIVFTVTVDSDASDVITNSVVITGSTRDPNPTDNRADEPTTMTALADLRMIKVDTPDPVAAGATLSYTLVYTNAGPSYARNVAIIDALSADVVFGGVVSASPPITLTSTAPPAWYTPTLAAGAEGSIVFTVTVNPGASGALTNSVTITSTTADPDSDNNRIDELTTISALPVLNLAKSDSLDPVYLGSNLVYTLTYGNGGDVASNVIITDTLPAGTTYGSANPVPAGVTPNSPGPGETALVWNVGAMGMGGSGTIVITVTVTGGDLLVNRVDIGCAEGVFGSATEQTTVVVPGQIAIVKEVSPSTVETPGLLVTHTYAMTISNSGTSTVTVQQITDTLPAGFTYITTTGWTRPPDDIFPGQTTRWDYSSSRPEISGGEVFTLTFTATSKTGGGTYCNSAGVTVGGSIGVVTGDNLACVIVSWPVYEIETYVGGLRIRVRVRMEYGRPVILFWEILP